MSRKYSVLWSKIPTRHHVHILQTTPSLFTFGRDMVDFCGPVSDWIYSSHDTGLRSWLILGLTVAFNPGLVAVKPTQDDPPVGV